MARMASEAGLDLNGTMDREEWVALMGEGVTAAEWMKYLYDQFKRVPLLVDGRLDVVDLKDAFEHWKNYLKKQEK